MNIAKLKDETHIFYKTIGSIWCDAVKDNVVFNNHGWKHIRFDGKGVRREPANIIMRFHLVKFAPEVVKESKIIIDESEDTVLRNGYRRNVRYYELAWEVDGGKKHVTVVLRRIEEGNLHFYSVRRTKERIKKALKRGLL